jgi:hypothetical protein
MFWLRTKTLESAVTNKTIMDPLTTGPPSSTILQSPRQSVPIGGNIWPPSWLVWTIYLKRLHKPIAISFDRYMPFSTFVLLNMPYEIYPMSVTIQNSVALVTYMVCTNHITTYQICGNFNDACRVKEQDPAHFHHRYGQGITSRHRIRQDITEIWFFWSPYHRPKCRDMAIFHDFDD